MKLSSVEKEKFRFIEKESKTLEKKIKAEIAAFETRYACRLFFDNTPVENGRDWQFLVGKSLVAAEERP